MNEENELYLLVRWVGSVPESAYDVVNISEIDVEDEYELSMLDIGSLVMIKCGRIKSPAYIQNVSSDKKSLIHELEVLKRLQTIHTVQHSNKKPKLDQAVTSTQFRDIFTQTENSTEVEDLKNEIQKLKAELYESNKLVSSICKDLKTIVHKTESKKRDIESNDMEEEIENDTGADDVTCYPIVELKNKILIGSNRTPVPKRVYSQINWLSFKNATNKLLATVFSRETLATHSLTGKPSPLYAGSGMTTKTKLDATKVSDIVELVSKKCGIPESVVRSAITTKCADEYKMFKKRTLKNKENIL